ncbi:MAG: cation-translocating P-type ATPase [Candidatus Bathyarchaeia archaeon]
MAQENVWHGLEASEALERLKTSIEGLAQEEAARRLKQYGFNELTGVRKVSHLAILFRQFKSILILILLVASAISVVTGHAVDAVVIFAIVLVSTVLGFTQEYRAERALEALEKMLSPSAVVIRDGKEVTIPAKEIVPGDILVLKEGDRISADARLIEVINLQTNEASLTGESMPVSKETFALPDDTLVSDRKNMVFSGTVITSGKGKGVVVATGMNTEFGKIAKHVTFVVKEETPLEKRTKEIGKWLSIVALSICVSMILLGTFRGEPIIEMVLFSIALAVAAVPEALPAVVTGSLAIGMYKMAKKNALVRKMSAVETLGSVTVICSDKTGTLTKGEMTVRKIYNGNEIISISGVGYEPKGEFHIEGDSDVLQSKCFTLLMNGAILCNDAELIVEGGKYRIRGDPTEGALIVVAGKAGFQQDEIRKQYPRLGELPFSSERKRMTTVNISPHGDSIVYMKGAPEVVLERCAYVQELDRVERLTEKRKKEILSKNEEMAMDALRVLGIAYKKSPMNITNFDEESLEKDLIFLGLMGMMDPPREEAIRAVEVCKQVQIKPIMITGDHKLTAMAIAKEIGIYREGDFILTGEDLEKMSDEEFEGIVNKVTVYARVSPEHKLRIVRALKKTSHVVAMTGDGVNDAPALKQADIGIAMGITGTDVTKESSDLVLADDNFATIVTAIELGRWIYDNVKKYLTYLLQANLVEIAVLSIAFLAGYPQPLLPVQILYINLATDGLPAIALGVSPSDPDVMKKPPRHPKETVFTREVKSFFLIALLVQCPLLLGVFLASFQIGETIARTRLFLALVFFELALALSCRSLKYTLFEVKPHRFLLLAILWEAMLVLTLISIPMTRQTLGITEIGLFEIGLTIGLFLITLSSIEIAKHLLKVCENKNLARLKSEKMNLPC